MTFAAPEKAASGFPTTMGPGTGARISGFLAAGGLDGGTCIPESPAAAGLNPEEDIGVGGAARI
jgi:hypothetical protein